MFSQIIGLESGLKSKLYKIYFNLMVIKYLKLVPCVCVCVCVCVHECVCVCACVCVYMCVTRTQNNLINSFYHFTNFKNPCEKILHLFFASLAARLFFLLKVAAFIKNYCPPEFLL